jgi:small subunit ribosomal protein S10
MDKIRIELKSFDSKLINQSCTQILENIKQTNSSVFGPIGLPTKKRIYCVLRSPHVNKDSREHFEIRTYKRILDVSPFTLDTVNLLRNLDLPSGIAAKIIRVDNA